MPFRRKAALGAAFFSFWLAACGTVIPEARLAEARAFGHSAGLADVDLNAGGFRLLTLLRQREPGERLRVYIEGDGAPWIWPHLPPEDPTPAKPLALRLAARDPGGRVAYLARPCQYFSSSACRSELWTTGRFGPEVIAAYQIALDRLKALTGAGRLSLVGYSGGGVLAALLAESRSDVAELLTVAAPLDTDAWTRHHQVTPLDGDNPAAGAARLRTLAQRHWVGGDDEVVPANLVRPFAEGAAAAVEVVPGYDHECCWADDWPCRLGESGHDH